MSEPNYMLYAEYMGRRNPVSENLDKFGGTFDQIQAAQRQRELDARTAQESDMRMQMQQLALQNAQEQQARQNELYGNLAAAQPTTQFVPDSAGSLYNLPSGIPSVMQTPALDISQTQNQSVFNTPGQIRTTQPDRLQIVFDHAMKYGALDEAKNAIDMKTLIANTAPDKVAADKAMQQLGTFTAALKHVKEIKQAGILSDSLLQGVFNMLPKEIQAYFPDGIQKDEVGEDGSLLVKDPSTGKVVAQWVTSPDGTKTELMKAPTDKETWSKPYTTKIGGKPLLVQESSTGQIKTIASDTSSTVKVNINNPTGDQVDILARGIIDGTINPDSLSKRGGLQSAVFAKVKQIDPKFDLVGAGANAKFQQNVQIQKSLDILDSISPLLGELKQTHTELGFGSYPAMNKAKRIWLEQTGDPRVTAYDNLRNNIILEVTNAMQGSSQMSDSRVRMEQENLQKAASPAQMTAAIENIRKVIGARSEAFKKNTRGGRSVSKQSGRFTVEEVK